MSIIRHSNPRPSEYESPPITIRPRASSLDHSWVLRLTTRFDKGLWCSKHVLCFPLEVKKLHSVVHQSCKLAWFWSPFDVVAQKMLFATKKTAKIAQIIVEKCLLGTTMIWNCGQSWKGSTIVNYDCRVVMTSGISLKGSAIVNYDSI